MKSTKNKNKVITLVAFGLFVVIGTYNSVVINSQSQVSSDAKFVKRLDEVFGVTIAGRTVAASTSWQKLPTSILPKRNVPVINTLAKSEPSSSSAAPEAIIPAAAVQEELTLSLVEVINPTKWQQGIPAGQFNGSLSTNNGVIEELSVALPNGEGLAVSFSEMTGNVFEYDLNGELYSGMMYQVDQTAYMVTLTNGPLEGTRMRFSANSPAAEQEQTQEVLAENNVQVGTFGEEAAPVQAQEVAPEQIVQTEQGPGFNLDQSQTM
jgi:hypothetical protein